MREKEWPDVVFVDTLASLARSLIENTRMPVAATRENIAAVGDQLRNRAAALEAQFA
jgi:hypothetical protein